MTPRTGTKAKASWYFNSLKTNEYGFVNRILKINGQLCYLSGAKARNKAGSPELQLIISFNKPDQSQEICKQRLQIEMTYKSLKPKLRNSVICPLGRRKQFFRNCFVEVNLLLMRIEIFRQRQSLKSKKLKSYILDNFATVSNLLCQ
jgi:hypothetical protein